MEIKDYNFMISKFTVILCYSHQLICKPKPCFKVDPLWQWVCQLEIRSMEGMSRNPAFGTWKPDFFHHKWRCLMGVAHIWLDGYGKSQRKMDDLEVPLF